MTEEELIMKNERVIKIAKALASETCWIILKLLCKERMDVSRIAKELKQTEANVSAQIKILENAGLITSHYEPGDHGVRKVCEPAVKKIIIQIAD